MNEPPTSSGLVAAPEFLAADVAPWVQALQAAAGPDFRALFLHGSVLAPRFDPQTSDINLLLVLRELPYERLETLARVLRERLGGDGRRWSPLVLTETQVRTSLDVFPAEFLDLLGRRALLAGEDVFAGLVVHRDNLRHQCEFELRSKLVGMRQAYLLAGGPPGMPQQLLVKSAGGLATVMRNLLALRGESTPEDNEALAAAVARAYGVDAGALGAPFAARRQAMNADEATARSRYAAHLVALETLIAAVDAHPST